LTAVFGAVTLSVGATMANATSLASLADPSSHVTLTLAFGVIGAVTAHGNVPEAVAVLRTEAAMVSHDAPPSRDSSSLTKEFAPRL
jgi:hypothetical protein